MDIFGRDSNVANDGFGDISNGLDPFAEQTVSVEDAAAVANGESQITNGESEITNDDPLSVEDVSIMINGVPEIAENLA